MSKEVLVVLRGDPSVDPRPYRFISVLAEVANVTIFSRPMLQSSEWANRVRHRSSRAPRSSILRNLLGLVGRLIDTGIVIRYGSLLHRAILRFEGFLPKPEKFSHIFVFEPEFLFLCDYRRTALLHFDAREYYPGQLVANSWKNKLASAHFERTISRYAKRAASSSTVGTGVRREYELRFGFSPHVLPSFPIRKALDEGTLPYKQTEPVRVVHHGIANSERRISRMVSAVELAGDGFTLDLYLTGSPMGIDPVLSAARGLSRITVKPPVAHADIGHMLRKYHVGLHFVPGGLTTNLRLGMPNKLFEYLEAGLPVVCSPSMVEMAEYIRTHEVGVVSEEDTVESLASSLTSLTSQRLGILRGRVLRLREQIDWNQIATPFLTGFLERRSAD